MLMVWYKHLEEDSANNQIALFTNQMTILFVYQSRYCIVRELLSSAQVN